MFDIANLEHLAEDKAINAKIEKLRAEKTKVEAAVADAERKIRQSENQIKRLIRAHSKQEYKARTRRLIQRGAIAEKFIADAETLTNDEFTDALAQAVRTETAKSLASPAALELFAKGALIYHNPCGAWYVRPCRRRFVPVGTK